MNEWLCTSTSLLRMAYSSKELSTYAALIEISKGSLLDEKAHMIPGLSAGISGHKFDYETCLELVIKTRSDCLF
jgi:hypothetical protein